MELKQSKQNNKFKRKLKRYVDYIVNRKILSVIVFICILVFSHSFVSLYSIYYGAKLHDDGYIVGLEQDFNYVIHSYLSIPYNFVNGLLEPSPESLEINISHKNWQNIAYYREIAFKTGVIPDSEYVPAEILYRGENIRIKLKLAGIFLDHVASDKWSLHIKIKGEKTLFGMKEFNLYHPKIRYGIYDWVCHMLEMKENLITLRRDYVDVTINGKHKGIYELEETFDKLLIENNRLREGILFKPTTPLRIYQREKLFASPNMRRQLALLNELFDRFLKDEIPTSALFDIEKLAKFYALTDLVNGFHQLFLNNMHFYFNPVSGLIEPIGREWDVHFYRDLETISGELQHPKIVNNAFHTRIFSDRLFYKEYIQAVQRISEPQYLDDFFDEINSELQRKLNILYKDYPYYAMEKKYFYNNQAIIRQRLNLKPLKVYYTIKSNGENIVLIQNPNLLPLEVLSISYLDTIINNEMVSYQKKRTRFKGNPIVLPHNNQNNKFQIFETPLEIRFSNLDEKANNLKLTYSLADTSSKISIDILPWPYETFNGLKLDLVRQQPNFDNFSFIEVDETAKLMYIKKGQWILSENLIIPHGYTVLCSGNVKINLTNSASILSYSPLQFIGTFEHPIHIFSADSSGQGVLVLSAKQKTILKYVNFENLSEPKSMGWELTGAVTFYESPVNISHCTFKLNRSEDALNIIRSKFHIENTLFSETKSDALDGDFITGSILQSSFVNCGNDAIDISGSNVSLTDVIIKNVGDKGLSAGEESEINANRVEIINTNIAVASKDNSKIVLNDIRLYNCKYGFTSFQKKPEFGPANILMKNLMMSNVDVPYLIEKKSVVLVEGEKMIGNKKNVKEILYGKEYEKSIR